MTSLQTTEEKMSTLVGGLYYTLLTSLPSIKAIVRWSLLQFPSPVNHRAVDLTGVLQGKDQSI